MRELIAKQRIDVTHVGRLIDEGLRLVDGMLALCDYDLGKETKSTMSLEAICPTLHAAVPSALIIPLQSSLTASLPSISAESAMHKPFPDHQVTFRGASNFARWDQSDHTDVSHLLDHRQALTTQFKSWRLCRSRVNSQSLATTVDNIHSCVNRRMTSERTRE